MTTTETIHKAPADGSGVMPCCSRTPFEAPRTDRMTANPANVTCKGAPDMTSIAKDLRNTWEDPRIVNDTRIDHTDRRIRAAAEAVHRNESLHRHDPEGPVCTYCALVAARAVGAPVTGIAPFPPRPNEWVRVGDLRQAIANLPDDSPIQVEYPGQYPDVEAGVSAYPAAAPALYAYEQASDAAGVCGTNPELESTCGVLIIGCDPDDPMAQRKPCDCGQGMCPECGDGPTGRDLNGPTYL